MGVRVKSGGALEVARYVLDPSIVLSEASRAFLDEPPEGHEILVSRSLTWVIENAFLRRPPRIEPFFGEALTQVMKTWELPYDSAEERLYVLSELYSPEGRLAKAILRAGGRGDEMLSEAEVGEGAIVYAATEAAVRRLFRDAPRWTASIFYQQVGLANLLECPVICASTSAPWFFEMLRSFGARAIEEVAATADEAIGDVKNLNAKWHEWKDKHPRVVDAITKASPLTAAGVEIVFVSLYPGAVVVSILAGGLFESFLILSMDPP